MAVEKSKRLEEFVARLRAAPPAATAEEALKQLSHILNDVEDEMTSIPYNPAEWFTDGRLYPPQEDKRHSVPGHPLVVRYRSKEDNTFIGANGSIQIQRIDKSVRVDKAGADGRHVWDLN